VPVQDNGTQANGPAKDLEERARLNAVDPACDDWSSDCPAARSPPTSGEADSREAASVWAVLSAGGSQGLVVILQDARGSSTTDCQEFGLSNDPHAELLGLVEL